MFTMRKYVHIIFYWLIHGRNLYIIRRMELNCQKNLINSFHNHHYRCIKLYISLQDELKYQNTVIHIIE